MLNLVLCSYDDFSRIDQMTVFLKCFTKALGNHDLGLTTALDHILYCLPTTLQKVLGLFFVFESNQFALYLSICIVIVVSRHQSFFITAGSIPYTP